MSHDATNWAIKQRGLKPALKVVLWNLCDRYHPDNGCFPSQDTLANDCEVPRSTLNVYLAELEGRGLIAREQRREAGSFRQERTRYRFPFEPDFPVHVAEKPSPETGHGDGKAESRNGGEPSPENGESRVQNLDSNLVREPVRETSNEREGASEISEKAQDRQATERAFKRWFPFWPTYVTDSEDAARRAWFDLSPSDRDDAAARTPDYLEAAKAGGRKIVCSSAVYLRERRWLKLPEKRASSEAPAVEGPFGKGWGALRLVDLLRPARPLPPLTRSVEQMILNGTVDKTAIERERLAKFGWPRVVEMHEAASRPPYRGTKVPATIKALGADFTNVRIGGDLWEAWRRLHEARGWPWFPDTGNLTHVWLPPVPASCEGDTDDAVQAAIDDFAEKARGVQGDEHAA